jgi:antitoxin MazE
LNKEYKVPFMHSVTTAEQTIEAWGTGLGVRIPAPIAKAARIVCGLPVRVEVVEGGVFIRAIRKAIPKLTLAQKLKAFDPTVHGGEVMTVSRVGAEVC